MCKKMMGLIPLVLLLVIPCVYAADPFAPAEVTVGNTVETGDVEPIGANLTKLAGGTNFANNNEMWSSGFEPIVWRKLERISDYGSNWFEWTGHGGIDLWQCYWTGFGNGAKLRFYRLVDESGSPLPAEGGNLDVTNAHHVVFLGEDTVPMPSVDFPGGGWISNEWTTPADTGLEDVRLQTNATDARFYLGDGVETAYYVVRAVDASGNESTSSNEDSATPQSGIDNGPRIWHRSWRLPDAGAGVSYGVTLEVTAGTSPYTWTIIEGTLPDGLTLDSGTGRIEGTPTSTPDDVTLRIQVEDNQSRADSRYFKINPPDDVADPNDQTAPEPPTGVTATANNESVTVSWTASVSSDVAFYRVYRSDTTGSEQMARVYLETGGISFEIGDYAFIKQKTNFIGQETHSIRVRQYWHVDSWGLDTSSGLRCKVVDHTGGLPSDFNEPGETCLEVDAGAASGVCEIKQVHYHPYDSGEGQWYSLLRPGAPYRVEVWLKQEGLGDGGNVRFIFTGAYSSFSQSTAWSVGGTWQKYTYDFTGPDYPTEGSHIFQGLEFTAPGKLHVDNFVLYRNDEKHEYKPFTPHEVSFDEFMDSVASTGKKPAIRFYAEVFGDTEMHRAITDYGNSGYAPGHDGRVGNAPVITIKQSMEYAYKTGNSPETRVVPYLTLIVDLFEEEWEGLIEYLGVPYDPEIDTPESKPYAYKRYVQRGDNGTPWTDEFREILVELGNETWHNGARFPQWDGFGPPGGVHQGGKEYGLFAKYIFDGTIMQMPEWTSLGLNNKIKFALGANYDGNPGAYAELAVRQGGNISYLGHANYVGAKWETGDTGFQTFNDEGVQENLVAMLTGMKDLIDTATATRDTLNSTEGTHYQVHAYEGGPSGYWMADDPEVDELYGKSGATGLAALDAWLYSSLKGYKHQCYLGYSCGKWWSSHTPPELGGLRPHIGWLALKLRNKYALGDNMLSVVENNMPTYFRDDDEGGQDMPLIGVYALKDDSGNFYVFVLSRKLDGTHDGVDFGDGYTPVTLHLPFTDPNSITLYKLAKPNGTPHDPRTNNREALNVTIVSENIDTQYFSQDFVVNENTGAGSGGIHPGAVYLYVFSSGAVSPPGQASNPNPADGATGASTAADLSWSADSGASSHDVYFGLTSPGDFQGNQPGTTFDPGTLADETTYYWRIDEKNDYGTTTGVVWSFTTGIGGATGTILREWWTGIGGTLVSDLTSSPDYPDNPSGSDEPTSFEAPTDWADNYGTRMRGYLYPTDSGDYTFWIASDDNGELWLSTDDNPANAVLIANVPDWSSSRQWDKYAEQQSSAISLTGGNAYYIEALQKEGGGGDNLAVAWQGPGISQAVIDGAYLSPWAGGAPQPPGQASNPSPADAATGVSTTADLSWTAGSGTTSHDVYFGTVTSPPFVQNQAETTYDPGTMAEVTTYFWRIDEVGAGGTTTGVVWSFTTAAAPQPPGQASNPSPADSATGVGINADLSWTAGAGADSHDVYFGTASPGAFQVNQTGTTFDPGTLSNDTTYYWRIDEKNAVGTTTGTVWSFTTIVAPPGQASNPNPADGATNQSIDVDLSWTAGADATSHDVYFGQTSPGTFQGNQPGTTFDPGTLANDTTYFWRIDEKNAGGTTTGVVWSFMTEAATPPPGQASNPSPADAATDVGIDTDLSWTAGAGADSHDVYFGTTSPGTFQGNQPGTTFDPGTLANDVTYYWRIDEKNIAGTTTGVVWSFTTGSLPTADANIVETTTAPTIDGSVDGVWASTNSYSIANIIIGTVTDDSDLSGTWRALWDSTNLYYLVEVTDDTLNNDSNNAWDDDSVELYIDADNSKGTSYDGVNDYQYVFRYNDGTIHLGSSSATNTEGIDFTIVATANGYNFEVSIPWSTLGVTAAQGSLIGTDVHVDDDDDGGSRDGKKAWFAIVDDSWTDPNTFATAELVAGGGPVPPDPATNPNPADGATNQSIDVDLTWSAGSGATSHDVYFGTPSSPPFVQNQTGTTFDPGTMANSTTYYWRIDEVNAQGTTTGSVWSFTTEAATPPPGQASNPNPADGATDINTTVTLSWTAGTDATSHDVYFGTSSPGTFQGNQTAATFDPGTLANSTTYYWRIDEVNAYGTTTGVVWSFTTVAAPPGQASNPSPADEATDVDINADLSWSAGSGATSHDVYFGTVTSPPFVQNQAGTTYDPGTMVEVTTYFWRIDEVGAGGTTTGVVWSFTTGTAPQPPGQATNPNPGDGATSVSVDADLSWTAGSGATSHDVYFGTTSPGTFQGNQPAATFDPGTLANDTTYYWRIDEVNAAGTTTGVVWSFTTEAATPPPGQASNPSPADAATDVSINADLSWTAGSGADSHDVYFGTTSPGDFQGNQPGTTFDPGTLANDTTYYWRIDEKNAIGTTTGVVWSFTTVAPSTWSNQDVGSPSASGSASESAGVWTIEGDGSDIWGTSDQFHYVYQSLSGDGEIEARVASLENTNSWAKAGVMIRESLTGGSTHAMTVVTPGNGTAFQRRTTTDGSSSHTAGSSVTAPYWVRLVRSGNTFTGYESSNGSSWNEVGSATVSMATDVYIGLAVTSHSGGVLCTAEIDNVTVTGGGPPPPPGQATNPSPADSATGIDIDADISWTAGSGATSHDVYFGTVTSPPFVQNQTGTTYDPGTLSEVTTHYWRIDEVSASGTTTGVVWSFTTESAPPPPTLTAYYCDVDRMSSSLPMTVGGNLNSKTEATSPQYDAIASSDDSRWTTPDPGNRDEVFLWLENSITGSIASIDLHFEGYLNGSSATFSIWARDVVNGEWDQIGTTQSISTGSDGTITRSITSEIANYVSGETLIWGVYESTSSQSLNIDYVNVVVNSD